MVYRYSNGVVVYGCGYPGEKVGMSGGACFVGSEGRIAVDRDNLVAYPAKLLQEPLGPDDVHLYKSTSHSGNFSGVHPHPAGNDLRRDDRRTEPPAWCCWAA